MDARNDSQETAHGIDRIQGVIPHLIVNDAAAALEFYKQGLGAREATRMAAPDGKRIMHAEIIVNGAQVFVMDHFAECCEQGELKSGSRMAPPAMLGGTPVTLHLQVADCDDSVKRAWAAGATVTMPPMDMFWGARYAQVVDPFGHAWSFSHPLPGQQG